MEEPFAVSLSQNHSRDLVLQAVRNVVVRARRESNGTNPDWKEQVLKEVADLVRPSLRRVINATGILLHTNLGRSPLPRDAILEMAELAAGYTNLEYDLDRRERGWRYDHCTRAFQLATNCEDALVVNNNAAAVMLALRGLAKGRDVLISRGELVEIGGGFRVPDILEASGARLKEVGTTNRTRLSDYVGAIDADTGMILKVHRSNFRMEGFVEEVEIGALVELGQEKKVPVMYDAGSATLEEARRMLESGLDVLAFSGDKMLGGPQSGILLGKKKELDLLKKEPWLRILRVDKITLSLLEYTVRNPLQTRLKCQMAMKVEELRKVADNICERLSGLFAGWNIESVPTVAMAGGGSLPQEEIPSWGIGIRSDESSLDMLEKKFHESDPPILGRIKDGQMLFDLRTVQEEELSALENGLRSVMERMTR
jgi:L-seryl-tRNA(Ser) seleniumtransferase